MAEDRSLDLFPVLRMQRLASIVVIQPQRGGEVAGPSLSCDLETGTLALAEHPRITKDFVPVFGVLGLAQLEAGPVLVVVTAVEEAARLRGHPLLRVAATQALADTANGKWKPADRRFLDLLRAGTDPARHGGSLYFAMGGDPTLSQQRYEGAVQAAGGAAPHAAAPHWARADEAVFWNKALAKPLLGACVPACVRACACVVLPRVPLLLPPAAVQLPPLSPCRQR